MGNSILLGIFAIIGLIILINFFQVIINMFTRSKAEVEVSNPLRDELRKEINTKVRPHLNSLEGMYEKSEVEDMKFSTYVYNLFKDTFSSYAVRNKKLVESEICKCCNDYESADCKEEYCLEGSGISCGKSK